MAESIDREGDTDEDSSGPTESVKTLLLALASMTLFLLGLVVTESFGEVGLDIDLKPFFLPYLLIAVTRYGIPTIAAGLGAAIGEGILDVFEGYELDDPVGFIGYVLGFTAFGWYLEEVAEDPEARKSLAVGAILGGFVQAVFEGVAFVIFESSASALDGTLSVLGNTVTHGLILGAVPLVVLYPPIRDRFGRKIR